MKKLSNPPVPAAELELEPVESDVESCCPVIEFKKSDKPLFVDDDELDEGEEDEESLSWLVCCGAVVIVELKKTCRLICLGK